MFGELLFRSVLRRDLIIYANLCLVSCNQGYECWIYHFDFYTRYMVPGASFLIFVSFRVSTYLSRPARFPVKVKMFKDIVNSSNKNRL